MEGKGDWVKKQRLGQATKNIRRLCRRRELRDFSIPPSSPPYRPCGPSPHSTGWKHRQGRHAASPPENSRDPGAACSTPATAQQQPDASASAALLWLAATEAAIGIHESSANATAGLCDEDLSPQSMRGGSGAQLDLPPRQGLPRSESTRGSLSPAKQKRDRRTRERSVVPVFAPRLAPLTLRVPRPAVATAPVDTHSKAGKSLTHGGQTHLKPCTWAYENSSWPG